MALQEDSAGAVSHTPGVQADKQVPCDNSHGLKAIGSLSPSIHDSTTDRLVFFVYALLFGSRDAVSSEDVELFQGTFALCIAVYAVVIMLSATALLADSAFLGVFVLNLPLYSFSIVGRLYAASLADQKHAVVIFGRIWLCNLSIVCGIFAYMNKYHHFCEDMSLTSACCIALLTAFVPAYLKLMGMQPGIRFLSCASCLFAYQFSPRWTEMPHAHAQLFMTIAVIAGEAAGNELVLLFRAPTAGLARPPMHDGHIAKPVTAPPQPLPDESGPTGQACSAESSHTPASRSSSSILELDYSAVRIVPVTLHFDPAQIQAQYRAHKFAGSSGRHATLCAVGIVLGMVAAIASPEEKLLGGVTVGFYLALLTANSIIREQKLHAERAVLLVGRAWVGSTVVGLTLFLVLQPQLHSEFEGRQAGVFVFWGILAAMLPAHVRLLTLFVEHELAIKFLFVFVFSANYLLGLDNHLLNTLSYFGADGARAPPLSCANNSEYAYYAMLTVLPTLFVGELVSYSIKSVEMMAHLRFLKASKLTAVAEQRAKAAEEAMLAEMAT
eukprot:6201333-Pleurochrysis_carterae.AAC.1